jgi:1-acyl-sn-glycerol-3-phosphate acyltransferase/nucleoside-diphosphate-sugar epimerase
VRSVVLLAAREPLTQRLMQGLSLHGLQVVGPVHPDVALVKGDPAAVLRGVDAVVCLPTLCAAPHAGPDVAQARRALYVCKQAGVARVIVVSSAEAYGATPRNPGLMAESRPIVRSAKNAISTLWLELEAAARELIVAPQTLTILRPCPVPVRGRSDYFSRLLTGRAAITLAGHDPTIQLLDPTDLASAIACAMARSPGGIFNVAPDGVIPLRVALERGAGAHVGVPRELQRHARRALSALGLGDPIDQLDYIRYSFTVSNQKIKRELGFVPTRSSEQALQALRGGDVDSSAATGLALVPYDDFGLDKDYIAAGGRKLFDFLSRHYWRIELEGLEHVPKSGQGVLVGLHRGLVAWDGVMVLHLLAERMQRYPRFLVHPTGFRFPYVFDFATKLGGVVACQENADYVLEHGELLGIFPEGIRGVFSLYREAYQLRKFGRHDFVKIALRHGAPIIPFVILGSAETYPILGKIEWSWLKRKTEWPFFPITPTLFPLMPMPLPAKWHIRFLPALEVGSEHSPGSAKDPVLVRSISDGVKKQMEDAIAEMASHRKSAFFG